MVSPEGPALACLPPRNASQAAGVGLLRAVANGPTRPRPYSIPLPVEGRGLSLRSWSPLPKQLRFDKCSAGTPGKKPPPDT
jgi:hypothetical protein